MLEFSSQGLGKIRLLNGEMMRMFDSGKNQLLIFLGQVMLLDCLIDL